MPLLILLPALVLASRARDAMIDFNTHPDRYKHWQLSIEHVQFHRWTVRVRSVGCR